MNNNQYNYVLTMNDVGPYDELNQHELRIATTRLIEMLGIPQIRLACSQAMNANINGKGDRYTVDKSVFAGIPFNVLSAAAGMSGVAAQATTYSPYTLINHWIDMGNTVTMTRDHDHKGKTKEEEVASIVEEVKLQISGKTNITVPIANRYPNPAPADVKDISYCSNVPLLVRVTDTISTFFSLKKGNIVYDEAPQCFKKLLTMKHYVNDNMRYMLIFEIEKVLRSDKSFMFKEKAITLKGVPFAHAFYKALYEYAKDPTARRILLNTINNFVSGSGANADEPFFQLTKDNAGIFYNYIPMKGPVKLLDRKLSFKDGVIDPEQAHYACTLSREFRGENDTDKGALNRNIYMNAFVGAKFADVCYKATNFAPLISLPHLILHTRGKASTLVPYLKALVCLDYRGIVTIDVFSSLARQLPRDATDKSRCVFPGASFKLETASLEKMLGGQTVPGDAVVFHISIVPMKDGKIGDLHYMEDMAARVSEVLDECHTWSCRVLTLVPMCNNMGREGWQPWQFRSTCEPHNNMLMAANFDLEWASWQYDAKLQMVEICKMSVIANVTRCLLAITNKHPYLVFKNMGLRIPTLWLELKGVEVEEESFDDELFGPTTKGYSESYSGGNPVAPPAGSEGSSTGPSQPPKVAEKIDNWG